MNGLSQWGMLVLAFGLGGLYIQIRGLIRNGIKKTDLALALQEHRTLIEKSITTAKESTVEKVESLAVKVDENVKSILVLEGKVTNIQRGQKYDR